MKHTIWIPVLALLPVFVGANIESFASLENHVVYVDGIGYPATAEGLNSALSSCMNCVVILSASISVDTSILLNRSGVTLQCSNRAAIREASNSNLAPLISIGASNTRITGCIIDGDAVHQSGGSFAVLLSGRLDQVDIDHNQIRNSRQNCIAVNNASNLRIESNRLSSCDSLKHGPAIDYTMNGAATAEANVYVIGNDIDSGNSLGGGINIATTLSRGAIQGIHVEQNTIVVGDYGSQDTLGIQLFTTGNGGFVGNGTVAGNRIRGSNTTNTEAWGISIGTAGVARANVNVTENIIWDTRKACIEAVGGSIRVSGNSCDDTGGIQVPTNSGITEDVTIAHNSLKNGSWHYAQIGVSGAVRYGLRRILISGNSIVAPAAEERCIFFNGNTFGRIRDSSIVNNVCSGRGGLMKQPGIELNFTSETSIRNNVVKDFSGSKGSGDIGILIRGTSANNSVGPNEYSDDTVMIQNNGFGTSIREPQISAGAKGNAR